MASCNGGPAFPCPIDCKEAEMGATLRDYFAIHAKLDEDDFPDSIGANSVVAGFEPPKDKNGSYRSTEDPIGWLKWCATLEAKIRYIKADAMLAEREKHLASTPSA